MQRKNTTAPQPTETDHTNELRPARRSARITGGLGFGVAALLSLLGGCEQVETNRGALIERTRVLGAHIAVVGEPARSTPRPGEMVEVSWLVTAPAATPPLGWAFVVCGLGASGEPDDCGGEPLAVFEGHPSELTGAGANLPRFTVAVPDAARLGSSRALSIVGMICADSEPQLNPQGPPSCAMGGEGTSAYLSLPLAIDGDRNGNPDLAASSFGFDGQPWAADPLVAACADLPRVVAGSKDHVLRLATTPADREPYTAMQGDPPRPVALREALQISHFTTAGKLDRPFAVVEAGAADDDGAVEVKWEAPGADAVPAEGLVVRFIFVARDLRGGTDWTSRQLCVVP
jgi:hypothetical protein